MEERLLRLEERQRSQEAALGDLRGRIIALETATPLQIRALDEFLHGLKHDTGELTERVGIIEQIPGRTAISRWSVTLLAIITGIVGYLLSWLPRPPFIK